jgi:hypothetical protein
MIFMRVRTLRHLLPWLLILGLGSCDGERSALRAAPGVPPQHGASGIEPERGGPGFMGAAG